MAMQAVDALILDAQLLPYNQEEERDELPKLQFETSGSCGE